MILGKAVVGNSVWVELMGQPADLTDSVLTLKLVFRSSAIPLTYHHKSSSSSQ